MTHHTINGCHTTELHLALSIHVIGFFSVIYFLINALIQRETSKRPQVRSGQVKMFNMHIQSKLKRPQVVLSVLR